MIIVAPGEPSEQGRFLTMSPGSSNAVLGGEGRGLPSDLASAPKLGAADGPIVSVAAVENTIPIHRRRVSGNPRLLVCRAAPFGRWSVGERINQVRMANPDGDCNDPRADNAPRYPPVAAP